MAKVRSPPKRDRRPSKQNKEKERSESVTATTPTRSTRSKSKASAENQTVSKAVDIDSGLSSAEKPRRTNSSKGSPKISKKSKAAISKAQKPTAKKMVKKLSEIGWVRGFVRKSSPKIVHSTSGIKTYYPSSLKLRIENNVEYVQFPLEKGKCSGFVKMRSGGEKELRISVSKIHFMILMGEVKLLVGGDGSDYKSGAVITVPKGVPYGLRNDSKQTCYMRFQTD